jgi:hypothetical protein
MSRAFITRLFIVGALVGGTACANGDSGTGPDPADHVLVQIEPKPIPFVIDNGLFYDKAFVADSSTMRLNALRLKR